MLKIPLINCEVSLDLKWSKNCVLTSKAYRCQITNQRTGLINHFIGPTCDDISILFVLAFENEEDRSSFSKYYTPFVEIKDYVLIDQQPFFELPVRNKKEIYERMIK